MNRGRKTGSNVGRGKLDAKERALLDRLREGDEDAFREIVEEHKDMIFRVAYSLCGNADMAKDISQDVLIRIFEHIEGFAGRSSLRTWIYRITVNTAISHTKRRSFLPLIGAMFDKADHRADPLKVTQQGEQQERLLKAVSALPERQKQAFALHSFEGLRYAEIAQILKAKVGTVSALINQATGNLRKKLGEEDNE